MNGPSKLSLAIALALIGGNAFALGLGSIQVKSGLNQPLDAEIAVTTESPAEAAGINVSMATAEDFERVGLSRGRVTLPIDFAVSTNSRGQAVIKLSTKEAVREPFLDFLVQVNWPKGKLLREYTVLLDPPVMAPAAHGAPATVTPAKEISAAPAQKLAAEEKKPKTKATAVKPPKAAAAEPKQPPASKPAPAAKPVPSAAPRTAAAGDYGPVAEGETLSEVARATRPDEASNVNQMMLALLKANPNAFYKDNINALKRGAILRIPSGDELKATGNAAAAAAAVRDQNETWGGGAAVAKPTVVANAGAPKTAPAAKTETKSSTKPSEHLALVPPRAGKESQASADRPGPSSGSSANADTKAELARTKEALASREQEATELKSRVKQLEDLNGKDQRLLSLKESEIAELQAKLKELQAKSAAASTAAASAAATKPATSTTPLATTPSTTAPATTATKPPDATKGETKLTAQDIWGNIAATEKAGATKPPATGTSPTTTTPSTTGTATTTPSSTTAPSTTGTPPPAGTGTTPTSTTPATPPSTTGTSPAATTAGTTPPSSTGTSTPTTSTSATPPSGTTVTPVTTPLTSAPTSLPSTTPATPAAKPTPPATTPKPITTPTPTEQPWYQSNMVLLGGGVGLLLIGLLTLVRFMRKPKPVLMPVEGGAEFEEQGLVTGDEEHHLLDALAQSPGDAHLSLELLNLYYSQRDAAKFEAAAEAMYAHIADPTQPEWQQVKAMGEELCPHNPLFSGGDIGLGGSGHREQTVFGQYDTGTAAHEDSFDLGGHDGHATKPVAGDDNFDFDLTDHAATAPAHDLGFAHEPPPPPPPPPVTVRAPVHAPAPAPAAVPAPKPAEDFFAGEDAIGTKLDLAKAYLDMGDPEGARSMLDEVMSEGNDAQKGEARKLLAEIR